MLWQFNTITPKPIIIMSKRRMTKIEQERLHENAQLQVLHLVEVLLKHRMHNISIKEKTKWDRYEREYVQSLEVSTKTSFVMGTAKGEE